MVRILFLLLLGTAFANLLNRIQYIHPFAPTFPNFDGLPGHCLDPKIFLHGIGAAKNDEKPHQSGANSDDKSNSGQPYYDQSVECQARLGG